MTSERGQATVEWTGLALLVAVVMAAAAAAAGAVGAAGLPQRLACALLPGSCAARPVLAALNDGPPLRWQARAAVYEDGPVAVGASIVSPAASAIPPVARFLKRHGKTIRKVVVGTAIAVGVGATCAGAVAAGNALGAAACGSAIVNGGYATYRNATD